MILKIFRKEKDSFIWKEIGLYIPYPETGGERLCDWGSDTERMYGIDLHTRIKLTKSRGFLRFELILLGFGLYYCSQWDY